MRVIDFHAHLYRDRKNRTYLVDEQKADMKKNGITFRLISAMKGTGIHEQNQFILSLCETDTRFLPCAVLNPDDENCLEELSLIESSGKFVAVELDSSAHDYIPEMTPYVDDIFAFCREKGMILKVRVGNGNQTLPGQWEYYIRRHPLTKTVILHMGGMWDGYSAIELAAGYPQVYLDTSGCFELSLMRTAFQTVSIDKILFGSGFSDRFTECFLTIPELFSELTVRDKEKIYYGNAARLLGIEA